MLFMAASALLLSVGLIGWGAVDHFFTPPTYFYRHYFAYANQITTCYFPPRWCYLDLIKLLLLIYTGIIRLKEYERCLITQFIIHNS